MRTSILSILASTAGLPVEGATLIVVSASVQITATFVVQDLAAASAAVSTFESAFGTASAATSLLTTSTFTVDVTTPPIAAATVRTVTLPAPAWGFTITGGCRRALGSAIALAYTLQGTTASGAPYYKAEFWDGSAYWLYWDPSCNGEVGSYARWIFTLSAPSITAASDLDGDAACDYLAYINSDDSSSPPQGLATWVAYCNSAWIDTDVTISQLAEGAPLERWNSYVDLPTGCNASDPVNGSTALPG